MTRTELLTNLINDYMTHNRYMTVDTFRDMFVNHIPGKLTFLAISRDGRNVLPLFDHDYHTTLTDDLIDYNVIRKVLGNDWTPVVTAHVWNRVPGNVPQTLLAMDGIVDEKVLHNIFGNVPRWTNIMGTVHGFNFGYYDLKTLPRLAMYTIDIEGARRIRTMNETDEGKVLGIHLDNFGYIRYLDHNTGKTVFARFDVGRTDLEWKLYNL